MAARIGPKKQRRIFLKEWREDRGLTQDALANRVGTAGMTVSRWERQSSLLNTNVMAAVAEALGIEPEDLYHHPDRPTPNQLMRGQPNDVVDQAIRLLTAIRRTD